MRRWKSSTRMTTGIVIMVVIYTGWGLWEIMTLPQAPLP